MRLHPFTLILALCALQPPAGLQALPDVTAEDAELLALLNTPISGASKREQRLIDSPQAIEVLTGEEIRQQGIYRLQDALKLMTSVDLLENDTYASYIGIRGIMQDGQPHTIQILVDGVPLYNAELGSIDVDNLPVPIDLIDKVEVVRGPSSTLYGANAVAGVISITTKRAPEGWHGGLRTALAERSTKRGSAEASWGQGIFGIVAGYSGAAFDISNYMSHTLGTSTTFRLGQDSSHQFNALVRPEWHFGGTRLWLSAGKAEKTTWSPNTLPYERFVVDTQQAGWGQAWSDHWHTELTVSRTVHEFHFGPSPATVITLNDPAFAADYAFVDFESTQAGLQVNWDPSKRFHLVAGADARRYQSGKALFLGFPTVNKEHASGYFLSMDWSALPNLTFSAGARAEDDTIGGSRIAPRAAVVWSPTEHSSLRAGYYDSTRSPQLLESRVFFNNYFTGPTCPLPPGFTCVFQILPNPDLKPERISSLEAGYRQSFGPFTGDLTVFQMKFRDLITQQNLPTVLSFPYLYIPTQDQNAGSATNRGIELSLQWKAAKWITLGGNATWQDFVRDSLKTSYSPGEPQYEFAYTPRHKVNLWTRVTYGRFTWYGAFQHVGAVTAEALQVGGVAAFEPRPAINQWSMNMDMTLHRGFSLDAYARNAARDFTPQGAGGPTRSPTYRAARRELGASLIWKW